MMDPVPVPMVQGTLPTSTYGVPVSPPAEDFAPLLKTYEIRKTPLFTISFGAVIGLLVFMLIITSLPGASYAPSTFVIWMIALVACMIVIFMQIPKKVERTPVGFLMRTWMCNNSLRFSDVTDIVQVGFCRPHCYFGRAAGTLTDMMDGVLVKTDFCKTALMFSPACGSEQFIAENRPYIPAMGGHLGGNALSVVAYQPQSLPPPTYQAAQATANPFADNDAPAPSYAIDTKNGVEMQPVGTGAAAGGGGGGGKQLAADNPIQRV
ncbi:unnamed protein product [Vitrella brassicaformis CCMP3155]|uniref:Uncharacterized protein n=2 Tax=Vitrella brassicaformis TaxID=1169539 RepID=A0A0G4H0I7_VITBC|nr:unnamed protein product [Vitrella brassicaformis CCMP3155]|eukprot:CEM36844.1 unnamed protein product [Vitrella brassicaformis CCMP3155]